MNERTPREAEHRQTEARAHDYMPPSHLPDPDLRDGLTHRWIRISTWGVDDPVNASKQIREGWEPCQRKEYPEFAGFGEPTKDGTIKLGGLILCKMPEQQAEARNAYYQNMTRRQLQSVDAQLMKESNPRMPLIRPDKRSDVTFGSGSKLSNFTDKE
jgi:hypothetical protein